MISVAELTSDPDFVEPLTLRRPTSTIDSAGIGTTTYADTAISGCIQPVGQDEAKFLPEGVRVDNVRVVFSATPISPGDGRSTLADVLVFTDGSSWRVFKCEPWPGSGYYRVLAEGFLT